MFASIWKFFLPKKKPSGPKIKTAVASIDRKIILTFDNDISCELNLAPLIQREQEYRVLRDRSLFRDVKTNGTHVAWGKKEAIISAERLWEMYREAYKV